MYVAAEAGVGTEAVATTGIGADVKVTVAEGIRNKIIYVEIKPSSFSILLNLRKIAISIYTDSTKQQVS